MKCKVEVVVYTVAGMMTPDRSSTLKNANSRTNFQK
jgi:hypothetical protein